ncbi:MAG: glycosyltransferase family 39 protein, partial [Solirubrobacteraceae bacterium]
MRTPRTFPPWLALALITALAAALRLIDLGAVRLDPFYDAAVRSMGLSWHNFFFGAYEPGGSVAIDKPPVDLWFQVGSVKLFGWGSTALKLPEALAGTAAVPLLYAALVRPFGVLAGLLAAAALAVLPIEVITARSDTMDAVMMLLLVLALLAAVRACEGDSTLWLLAAAAALGIAFNVKLLESIVAVPGLLVLVCLGMESQAADPAWPQESIPREEPPSPPGPEPGPAVAVRQKSRTRLMGRLAAAGAVYAIVALSWLGATLLFAAHERPYAIGSTNGSAWNAAFVFNGTERLSGKTVEVGQSSSPAPHRTGGGPVTPTSTPIAPPSPTRLLAQG